MRIKKSILIGGGAVCGLLIADEIASKACKVPSIRSKIVNKIEEVLIMTKAFADKVYTDAKKAIKYAVINPKPVGKGMIVAGCIIGIIGVAVAAGGAIAIAMSK